jgi:Spy/CpxP family protein refolding chaperone
MKMARRKKIIGVALALLSLGAQAARTRAQSASPAATPAPQTEQQQQQPSQTNADQLELIRSLNLTDEQRVQIAQIRRETEEQARQVNQRLRRARRALEEALYTQNADESLIQARTREVADAEAARVKMRSDAELKIRRVLTPEQLGTFRELRRQAQLRQRQQRQQNALDAGEPRTGAQPPPRSQQTPVQRNGNAAATRPLTPRQQRQIERGRRLPPRQ